MNRFKESKELKEVIAQPKTEAKEEPKVKLRWFRGKLVK